jgi:hypothetical protein
VHVIRHNDVAADGDIVLVVRSDAEQLEGMMNFWVG